MFKLFSKIGKTVIIKKKAQLTKEVIDAQGLDEEVYFIPLTSCDMLGRPSHPTALFDMFSSTQMMKHGINTMTVQDLHNEFEKSNVLLDESKDLFLTSNNSSKDRHVIKVFEDAAKKFIGKKIDQGEFYRIMKNNGINRVNAIEEINSRRLNPGKEEYKVDVYNLLYSFIREKKREGKRFHVFVDEFPVLYSPSSKWLICFY